MASPRNTDQISYFSSPPGVRNFARRQRGWYGDKKTVYPYESYRTKSFGTQYNPYAGSAVAIDAVNTRSLYYLNTYGGIPDWAQPAYNKCYARFKEEAFGKAEAELGMMAATWKQGTGMITKRLNTLYNAATSLKQGDFERFLQSLRLKPLKKHRGKVRATADEVSSLWLEYWFGWSPLLADIHATAEIMCQPLPYGPVRARAKAYDTFKQETADMVYDNWTEVKHQIIADVILENPNLYLLNQVGLANPATVIWDKIPFSFVVDWFFDVTSYLESFTDFMGVKIDNLCVTHYGKWYDTTRWKQWYMTPGTQTCIGDYVKRHTTLLRPLPNTQWQANLGSSLTRAATAASLLTQLFVSFKKR